MNRLLTLALFALPLAAQADPGGTPPRFEDFPEKSRFAGRPAAPILDTPFARKFRTVLRQGASQGPNFAGHFTVVEWGCGGGCRQLAIVDARSGKVIPMPFATMALPAISEPVPDKADDSPHEEYRLDSRLLALVGCRDEDPARCGTHYFLMDGMALKEPPWNEGKRPPGSREAADTGPAGSGHGGGEVMYEYQGRFVSLVIGETSADNERACGPDSGPCYSYDSKVEFVSRAGSPFHDIIVTTDGVKAGDEPGRIQSLHRIRHFSFADGIYLLKPESPQ